ncbi:hypothetical protein IAR55_003683 [Kwoniella newhampshirensis]|uniref:DNA-directed RNA polymerase III subunit RPC3 n=1 Tax=Kwoniella newhampshirensis TaxID=1651941 RepID=A0AAW0YNC9_9TREE
MSGNGKEAVRLCEHIVRQAFGQVVCRVASTLLNRGRLPAPTIARLAGLPRPTTYAALLILIQHDLVQSNGASYKDTGEDEQYEFGVMECMMRLRWGRILAITHEKLDDVALEVVRQLMIYGKLKVPEIIASCGGGHNALRAVAVNDAIITLLRGHFLQPTHPELAILESDQVARRYAAGRRRLVAARGSALLSPQDQSNLNDEAQFEVRQEREGHRDIHRVLIQKAKVEKEKKRRKGKAVEEFDYELKSDIPLRVNYDRYGVLIRNELIVKAAEDRWNKGAGVVMRAILDASLRDTSVLRDDRTHDAVGPVEIMDRIPNTDYPLLLAGLGVSTKTAVSDLVRHYLNLLAGEDQMVGAGGVFLQKEGTTNPGYQVELEAICRRLRETMLTELVRQKLGDKAARVLTVVSKSSKVFETTVRDCAMVPLKEARRLLAELQRLSLVETQEVPKTGAKSRMGLPSSMEYHLWAVDLPRVYGVLLTGVYKTLGNVMQRKAKEVERRKLPLAREARVLGQEGGRGLLQLKDQEDLADLDDALNKLSLAETRSELVVFILRDLPGWPGQR